MTTIAPKSAPQQRVTPSRNPSISPRVSLQRRAPKMFRRHLLRAIARVVILTSTDLSIFLALRAAIRVFRDGGLLGPDLALWLQTVVPKGTLGGWEYAAALFLGLAFAGSYGRGDARRDPNRILGGVALASGLALWHTMTTVSVWFFVMSFSCTFAIMAMGVLAERHLIDLFVSQFYPNPHQGEKVLFVGNPTDAVSSRAYNKLVSVERMVPMGWLSPAGARRGLGVLGTPEQVWDVLRQSVPDTVVLCGNLANSEFESVVEAATLAGCRVLSVSRYSGIGNLRPGLVWHRGLPFVELTVPSLKARHLLIKRVIDVIGALAGLLVLSPLFGLIALAIKLDSPGPVFFFQDRVGMGGRVFRFVKFRTMRDGADAEKNQLAHLNHTGDPRLFKIPNDPRITRLGVFLRKWSLDELPQLWNVLVGDMSLVGPRPFFESDFAAYHEHHFLRLGAKPGITGLWQVSGRSSVLDFEEVVRLDREYIDGWSIVMDLKILFRTVPAVLTRSGAY